MFSGTVRSNLDPFGDAGGDGRIWGALAQARWAAQEGAGWPAALCPPRFTS